MSQKTITQLVSTISLILGLVAFFVDVPSPNQPASIFALVRSAILIVVGIFGLVMSIKAKQ